jgi:cysteinyl-tRNA synthetase
MTELRLYNALVREKQVFEPIAPPEVRMYTCGPTVYSHAHVGNMRSYVFADVLKRTLLYFGYSVKHVINITDVGHLSDDADFGEDKMELAARKENASIWDIAERYTELFRADLRRLNVLDPDIWCKATDHISEQIAMIQTLEDKGFTYRTSDGIYFDTSKDPSYGQLSRVQLGGQEAQDRIERADEKLNPADFALWKFSPAEENRQMEWDSPWGRGFPGWHIECSAMSSKYLGEQFDIHTGGIDHLPVHHPNEVAQSENALGVHPWVRFWLHNGWLMFGEAKISKSTGGLLNLDDLIANGIDPLAFRLFFLSAVYRQQLGFSVEAMERSQTSYRRLLHHAELLRDAAGSEVPPPPEGPRARFRAAIGDDLNTPQALAVLWEVVRGDAPPAEKWALMRDFDRVLGLDLESAGQGVTEEDARVDALLRERAEARQSGDFTRADEIRDQLRDEGILIEDSPQGTTWRRA